MCSGECTSPAGMHHRTSPLGGGTAGPPSGMMDEVSTGERSAGSILST